MNINSVEPRFVLGFFKLTKGDIDDALNHFSKCTELNQNFALADYLLSIIKYAKGDLDGSLADVNRFLQIYPEYAGAHALVGSIKFMKGDMDGSQVALSKAVELNPTELIANMMIGFHKLNQHDVNGAIAVGYKFIELVSSIRGELQFIISNMIFPKDSYFADQLNTLKGIIPAVNKLIKTNPVDPNIPSAYCTRGYVKIILGDLDGAVTDFDSAKNFNLSSGVAPKRKGKQLKSQMSN